MVGQRDMRWFRVERTFTQLDGDQLRERSRSVPSQIADGIMLLVRHNEQPVQEYVYGDAKRLKTAGRAAGFTVQPVADEQLEELLPVEATSMAHPVIPFRSRLNRVSNMEKLRTDTTQLRHVLEMQMPANSFVAVHFRQQGHFEHARIHNWVSDEYQRTEDDSELVTAGTLMCRVSVGTNDAMVSRDLAYNVGHALMPLMDTMKAHRSRPRLGLLAVSLLVLCAWIVACVVSPVQWQVILVGVAPLLVLLATNILVVGVSSLVHRPRSIPLPVFRAAILMAVAIALMTLPIPWWTLTFPSLLTVYATYRLVTRDSAWDDIETRPRHYWSPIPRLRGSNPSDNIAPDGHINQAKWAKAYPTQYSTLIIDPMTTTCLITPSGEGQATRQELHPVPETLTHGGVLIGTDQTDRDGYLDAQQLWKGVAILGEMGSGKSVLTLGILQWAVLHKQDTPSSVWGDDSRIITFEMKDTRTVQYLNEFRTNHHLALGRAIQFANPNTYTLDLFAYHEHMSARNTAEHIAASMQYSFEEGDIRGDSLYALVQAFTIGVAAQRFEEQHPQVITDRVRSLEQAFPGAGKAVTPRTPLGWAAMAMTSAEGQISAARALGQVMAGLAVEYADSVDLRQAASAAQQLYGGIDNVPKISDNTVLGKVRASLNKIQHLMAIEHVFDPKRARISWQSVLQHRFDCHLVFAPVTDEQGVRHSIADDMHPILAKWVLYALNRDVPRFCEGWQEQGKHVMIVCDELSVLAKEGDTILPKMRDQWRAYGAMLVFATQFPAKLPVELRASFMGYGTLVSFANANPLVAQETADRFTDADGEDGWTRAAVTNLPQFTAAVRTRTAVQQQPTFLVRVRDFEREPIG